MVARLAARGQGRLAAPTRWASIDPVGDLRVTSGNVYRQGDAFTLETQHYPDSPHHIGDPSWPSVVLNAGGTFNSNTAFKFSVNHGHADSRVRFR